MLTRCNDRILLACLGGALGGLLVLTAPHSVAAQAAPAAATTPTADSAESATYRASIEEAVQHFSAGRWSAARSAFARAHALAPSARTFRGLGLAAFYLQDFVAARNAFEQALRDARKALPADQRSELERLLALTVRETGRFELQVSPQNAQVMADGAPVTEPVLVLGRGAHVISLQAEGYQSLRSELAVHGAEDRALSLAMTEQPKSAEPEPGLAVVSPPPMPQQHDGWVRPTLPAPAATKHEQHGRVWAWVTLAAVPVFAGTAGALWFTGLTKHDRIEKECTGLCTEAEVAARVKAEHLPTYETWTNVALAATAGTAVLSGLLFLLEDDSARDSRTAGSLAVIAAF